MLFNPFKKGGGSKKKASLERILDRLIDMGPNSANCSLIKTRDGNEVDEDLGRTFIFKTEQEVLVQNKAFYISTPDGMKAEDKSLLTGKDEILHLWFLHNRIPHTLDCRLMGRIRFPDNLRRELDPRLPVAYMVRPVGNIRNSDKRTFLRYAHKAGHGSMRVYAQILFDLYITKTDVVFPETGSLPPYIDDPKLEPYETENEMEGQSPEDIVKFMKNALRLNTREARVVYVSKPHMDEKTNKVTLLEMDKSDVLGLETSKEESRTFYIRKPPKMSSDRKGPYGLRDADTIVLGFHTRVASDTPTEYYDMIADVTRVGTENMTVRTDGDIRKEAGIPVEMEDFSVGGIKIENSNALMTYLLGEEHASMGTEEKIETLGNMCYLLNFYPKLRFQREQLQYEPELPMRIQILGKIVRAQMSTPREGEEPQISGFGVKFYYDPIGYSRDTYSYDRWELIRDFKENKLFREIHTSLNQLIGFLESQSR